MQGDIELQVETPSGKGFLKSIVSSESVFKPTYTGTGTIFFGPPIFGMYHILELDGDPWIIDSGGYVCSDESVEVGSYTNKALSGFFSGEGFFQTQVEGTGTVVIQAQGPIHEIELENDTLTVDGPFAVARQGHLDFSVEKATKGLIKSGLSGEGLVNVIKGTGKVLLAPVPSVHMNIVNSINSPILSAIASKSD